MRFQPKSEEEIQASLLLAPGIYDFEVTHAENAKSKSGNDMIKLYLRVWDKQGNIHNLFDYLLEQMAFKLIHFCEATGLTQNYLDGNLDAEDCIGKSGKVDIVIQKDKTGQYPDKNAVKDYEKLLESVSPAIPKQDDFKDDDVPF